MQDLKIAKKVIIAEMDGSLHARQVGRIMKRWKPGWRAAARRDVKATPGSRRGRPTKLTGKQEAGIAKSLLSGKIPKEVADTRGVSASTIRRTARKRNIIHSTAQVKPELSVTHQAVRAAFSDEMLQRKTEWWKYVLWTDECKIPLTPTLKKGYYRLRGSKPKFVHSRQHSKWIWLWAGISWHGVTSLKFLDLGREKRFTADRYKEQVLANAQTMLKKFPRATLFMEDGAPYHTAGKCENFRASARIRTFPTKGKKWPAKSPDLNPIENVWSDLKRRVHDVKPYPSTETKMKKALSAIWNAYDLSFIRRFISSVSDRLNVCLDNDGGATKY